MKTIRQAIMQANDKKSAALIAYITAGDPDLDTTKRAIKALSDSGVSVIELGVAFTDPVADGSAIQKSARRALKNPFSMDGIFELVKSVRNDGVETPIALYTYGNPVFNLGYKRFVEKSVEAGVQGSLIVDLPPEETAEFTENYKNPYFENIYLCSPTTNLDRLQEINKASTAFTYYVAQKGVTGVRSELPEGLTDKLVELRKIITTPLGVGFGISKPEHARILAPYADAVVIGSAYVNMFENYQGDDLIKNIADFTLSVADSLNRE